MNFRLLDTGIKEQSFNICMDRALLDLRKEDLIPDTFRFLRFKPCALVGFHQSVQNELRQDYCALHGIEIGRRITGGGAIYFDKSQLGWEMVFSTKTAKKIFKGNLERLTEDVCNAFSAGINRLGIGASFRPRNDIEVGGRKISGTGGAYEPPVYFFQGTLLLDFNPSRMVSSLKLPVEKLTSKNFDSILSRVASVKDILGRVPPIQSVKDAIIAGFSEKFGIEFVPGALSGEEKRFLKENQNIFRSKKWIHSAGPGLSRTKMIFLAYRCAGGTFKVYARVDMKMEILRQIYFTGDFFVTPRRAVSDLECSLKDVRLSELEEKISGFIKENNPRFENVKKVDLLNISSGITERVKLAKAAKIGVKDISRFMFVNGMNPRDIPFAKYLLLPYCAKKKGCRYRTADKCGECGGCETGDAYKFAKTHGITPKTIVNYENLEEILAEFKANNVKSYIGFCCKEFYIKRNEAFRKSGIKALLIDISSPLCYNYNKENEALKGFFREETTLGAGILKNLI